MKILKKFPLLFLVSVLMVLTLSAVPVSADDDDDYYYDRYDDDWDDDDDDDDWDDDDDRDPRPTSLRAPSSSSTIRQRRMTRTCAAREPSRAWQTSHCVSATTRKEESARP